MCHRAGLFCLMIALQIVRSNSCDAQPIVEDSASREDSLAIRDLALSSYRANYGLLRGVRCRLSCTISLNLDILKKEAASVDPATLAASPIKTVRVRPLRPTTVTQTNGISSTTSDHLVLFCDDRVRNERRSDGELQAIDVRDGDCHSFQSLAFGGKRTQRRRITEPLVVNGPIIDPRDFGAASGVGSLVRMLETWEPISARRDVKQRDIGGLIELTLREPVAHEAIAGFANRCTLYLDPHKNHLPVFAEHWQGANLSIVVTVTYARCGWIKSPCYLPAGCVKLMPSDGNTANAWSEEFSRSTLKYVVTEIEEFPSACDDATYQTVVSGGDYSDSITGTLVHAPNTEAIVHGAVSRVADTSGAFKFMAIGMMALLGIALAITLRGLRHQ